MAFGMVCQNRQMNNRKISIQEYTLNTFIEIL